jgi:transcription factor E2F7/8
MRSFLEVFSDRIGQDINLSDAASSLDVERRRIYDIVNVFESLEVVRRKAKNIYIYQGLVNLDATLGKLKVQPSCPIGLHRSCR